MSQFLKKRLAKVYHYIRRQYFTNFGLDKDLILIYTMSKVGSSSVYYSLKKKYPYKEIHHIHFLGETWLDSFRQGHSVFNNNLKHADALFRLLGKKNWNIKIITLTRDPIARNISGIFQTWQHIFDVVDINDVTPEAIINQLKREDFSYAQNWFETDFLEFTGLDVFKQSFNAAKGFEIYSSPKAPVLIMQLEQLNSVYNNAMSSFLGSGDYVLHQENLTASKDSAVLNKTVKQLAKFPDTRLRTIYDTFYNELQIDKLKLQWTEK